MAKYIKENKILLIIIIIGLIASCIAVGQRFAVEAKDRTVDIMLDYEEIDLLAQQSENDTSWWLSEFADMGINKVGLHEETLDSLTKSDKPIKAELVNDLLQDTYFVSQASDQLLAFIDENVKDDYDVMVIANDEEMYNFVLRAFTERFDPKKTKTLKEDGVGYILIDGSVHDSLYHEKEKISDTLGEGFREENNMVSSIIFYLNLGILPEKAEAIQAAGCRVEPRTIGYEGWNDNRFLDDVVGQYEALDLIPDYWIMGSLAVPGYDDGTSKLTDYINNNDITIGIVENTTQRQNIAPDGMEDVIEDTNYDVVRVFSVWNYIQYRYAYYGYDSWQEVENSLFRAIVERNIKLIYYKPMKETDDGYSYITDIKDYRDSFARLEERLAEHGISIGDASPSEPYKVPLALRILGAIAAGCAALLCLKEIFPIRNKWIYILLVLGVLGVLGAFFLAPNMASLITSFAAAVTMGCMAVIWMIRRGREIKESTDPDTPLIKIVLKGIGVLVVGVVIALAGAVMTAAPISSINFMIELDIFRGVKPAQLAPIAFFGVVFGLMMLYFWTSKEKTTLELKDLKWAMNVDIKVWMILILGVVGFIGYVYIMRTGHESNLEALNIELIARNYLEEILYARPRTKEFLIAFPSAILFIYSLVKDFKLFSFLFGAGAVLGFTSVINTFMHIRTPLELGFARTAGSLIGGIVVGIIYVVIFDIIYKIHRKHGIIK